MGWSIGHDSRWGRFGRDIGYGVPATCDHPGCGEEIHRGLSYVCGSEPYGGDHGCGLFFCAKHRSFEEREDDLPQLCARCAAEEGPFEPTPDVAEWIEHKLTDESWAQWRAQNAEEVALLQTAINSPRDGEGRGDVAEGEGTRPTELKSDHPLEKGAGS